VTLASPVAGPGPGQPWAFSALPGSLACHATPAQGCPARLATVRRDSRIWPCRSIIDLRASCSTAGGRKPAAPGRRAKAAAHLLVIEAEPAAARPLSAPPSPNRGTSATLRRSGPEIRFVALDASTSASRAARWIAPATEPASPATREDHPTTKSAAQPHPLDRPPAGGASTKAGALSNRQRSQIGVAQVWCRREQSSRKLDPRTPAEDLLHPLLLPPSRIGRRPCNDPTTPAPGFEAVLNRIMESEFNRVHFGSQRSPEPSPRPHPEETQARREHSGELLRVAVSGFLLFKNSPGVCSAAAPDTRTVVGPQERQAHGIQALHATW